ncbi:polysaccharide polymerase [Metaclostridioides mangenotii]|uniref:polysaccharide polymerase n=1 Tax=Metaclostridioides mangenotii TaxID=1540 RepID=UPI00214A5D31|nr:polysaccharide polymerase [Clostridioides mangenotii]
MKIDSLQNYRNLIFNKMLYTLTLIMVMLRKYMISILKLDSPALKIVPILFYASIALLLIQFIMKKYHNKSEIASFLIACALYIFTREGSILFMILLAISIRDIDDKYVVKSYLIMTLVFMIGCMLLSNLFPYITQVEETHYRLVKGVYVLRETFGFSNPNSVFLFSLPIYAAYIFLRFDNYNRYDRLLLIVMTIFIYSQTKSRTGVLTIVCALIFVELLKVIDFKKNFYISIIIKKLPVILLLISIVIGTVLSKTSLFNMVLSARPAHWNSYISEFGSLFTLFGNKYSEVVQLTHPLDSSYIYTVAYLGLITLIFILYLLHKGLDIFIENNQKKYIAVIILFVIYSFAENVLFEVGYNFTIILLIKTIIEKDKGRFTLIDIIKLKKGRKKCLIILEEEQKVYMQIGQ